MSFDQTIIKALNLSEQDLVDTLAKDVQELFSTMVGMDDILHESMQSEPATHFRDSVSAMVGLAGSYSGIVSLHASQKLALAFTSGMLGMEVAEVDDDVRDALGEISNMIAGSVKQCLSSGGADIKLSTPTVVASENYTISSGTPSDTLTFRFAAGEETFLVSAALKRT